MRRWRESRRRSTPPVEAATSSSWDPREVHGAKRSLSEAGTRSVARGTFLAVALSGLIGWLNLLSSAAKHLDHRPQLVAVSSLPYVPPWLDAASAAVILALLVTIVIALAVLQAQDRGGAHGDPRSIAQNQILGFLCSVCGVVAVATGASAAIGCSWRLVHGQLKSENPLVAILLYGLGWVVAAVAEACVVSDFAAVDADLQQIDRAKTHEQLRRVRRRLDGVTPRRRVAAFATGWLAFVLPAVAIDVPNLFLRGFTAQQRTAGSAAILFFGGVVVAFTWWLAVMWWQTFLPGPFFLTLLLSLLIGVFLALALLLYVYSAVLLSPNAWEDRHSAQHHGLLLSGTIGVAALSFALGGWVMWAMFRPEGPRSARVPVWAWPGTTTRYSLATWIDHQSRASQQPDQSSWPERKLRALKVRYEQERGIAARPGESEP